MIEKIVEYLLTRSINHKYLVKVRPFLAAKIVNMFDYVKPIKGISTQKHVIHIGTYDLTTDKTPEEISEILRMIKEL